MKAGRSTLLTVGTASEEHRIRKDKSVVENGKYLVCLEHRVGVHEMDEGGGSQVISDGYAKVSTF